MAYTINKSDGSILANVPDGQIDRSSSDITLIGKNYNGFGEALNENLVKLLENFANSIRPERPVRGQIWFDTSENKLKVYTGVAFVPVSSATIANSQPGNLGIGDLWFNNIDKQLYFFDGNSSILLGPDYSVRQGLSGIIVETILDKNNTTRVITYLYTNGILLGIFSKDQFVPKLPIVGFNNPGEDKIIFPGFNAGNLAGLKFSVTAENAEKLNNIDALRFARRDDSNIFSGQISINVNDGIVIGDGFQAALSVDVGNVILSNTSPNRRLEFRVNRLNNPESAINIISSSREIQFYNNFPDSIAKFGGSVEITSNLTVLGTTTTINSTVLEVTDKNIELAKVENPSDATADGGGIILKGTSDHEFLWIYNTAVPGTGTANESWNSTENINLATGKSYKIDGIDVLTSNACLVSSFPNVVNIGAQIVLETGPIIAPATTPTVYTRILNNRISTVDAGNPDLEIDPLGNVVLIGSPKITGLTTTNQSVPSLPGPTGLHEVESISLLSSTELSEATSKRYVLNLARSRSLVFSLDISDAISNSAIGNLLTQLAPPAEYENGTIARILCSSISLSSTSLNINALLVKNNSVEYSKPIGTGFPLQDIAVSNATISPSPVSVFRVIKTYQLIAGAWAFQF